MRTSYYTLFAGVFLLLLFPCSMSAQTVTYSEEELETFRQLHSQYIHHSGIGDWETVKRVVADYQALLRHYPQTILKKDILHDLFEASAALHIDCAGLDSLGQAVLALDPSPLNYHLVARGLQDNNCRLPYAQHLVEQAIQMLKATPNRHVPDWYQTLGRIQRQRQLLPQAIDSFRHAIALLEEEPIKAENAAFIMDYAHPYKLDLARTLWLNHQPEDALLVYEGLVRDAPKDEALRRELEQKLVEVGRTPLEVAQRLTQLREEAVSQMAAAIRLTPLHQAAPPFSLEAPNGHRIGLAELQGKVVLVSFWAGWCAPCLQELPFLVELDRRYRTEGLQVLGINVPDSGSPFFEQVITEYSIAFPLLRGDQQVLSTYGVPPIPLTVLIDKHGRLRYRHLGYDPHSMIQEQMIQEIEYLLKEGQ